MLCAAWLSPSPMQMWSPTAVGLRGGAMASSHCAPHSPWSLTETRVKEENPPKPTNWKTTHHETRWPTWSLNAFEPKVSWGALRAKNQMWGPLNNQTLCLCPCLELCFKDRGAASCIWEWEDPICCKFFSHSCFARLLLLTENKQSPLHQGNYMLIKLV